MRILATIICTVLFFSAIAQQQPNRADLEKRRQAIMEAIRQTEEQLEATKKNKNASLSQLQALKNKLAERQRLINNINDEIGNISTTINKSNQEVTHLKSNLEILKAR